MQEIKNQRLIDSFEKNSSEIVKIQLEEIGGAMYFDIRSWLKPSAEGEAEMPTKKGITMRVELLPQLIAALEKADESLEGRRP